MPSIASLISAPSAQSIGRVVSQTGDGAYQIDVGGTTRTVRGQAGLSAGRYVLVSATALGDIVAAATDMYDEDIITVRLDA